LAREVYRFLLRMPLHVRQQLAEAAKGSGRSLNAEIVHRLEESLVGSRPKTRGETRMSKRGWRLAVAAVLALAVAVAVAVAGRVTGTSGSATAIHKLQSEYTVGKGNEGIGEAAEIDGAAQQAAFERAYPASEIPLSATLNAASTWNDHHVHGAHSAGAWQLIGPSRAVYPSVLTPFIMGGTEYLASGRTTALAIGHSCVPGACKMYVGAAGGGIWRTDNALAGTPSWEFISGSFASNAIGAILVDPNSPDTLYVGTGESHASGDSEAGMGIFKSTDGGDTWSLLPGSAQFAGRAISSLVMDHNGALYAGVARAVRGVSSVTGGATSNPPVAVALGLYKSSDGGATFSSIWNGNASVRGVSRVVLDPTDDSVLYASAYQQGIWRMNSDGTGAIKILAGVAPAENTDRAEFAVTTLSNGNTRMYAADGSTGSPIAQFFRSDDVRTGVPVFLNLTLNPLPGGNSDIATRDYCTGQCWYDQFVYTPKGHPDIVYLGGSWQYGEIPVNGTGASNGRGVVLSSDAGKTWTDQSRDVGNGDGTSDSLHPDQHFLVTNPNNPYQWWEGSDGGVVRSSGHNTEGGAACDSRGLSPANLAICQSLLAKVPTDLTSLNRGLSTLQFQSLSASFLHPTSLLQGGTQDNGTFQFSGSMTWPQIIYGDGGQSGFNNSNDNLRFNTFFGQASDVNFQNGDPTKWVISTGPVVSSPEGSNFYMPIIPDPHPARAGSIFLGSQSVWRTQDWGGNQAFLETNCPEFTTSAANPACGDYVRIGGAPTTDLTSAAWGDRAGSFLAAVERGHDTGTQWVGSNTGRVFISKNADAAAASVTFTRLDTLATNDPGRFVSSIWVDPDNPNHAWISYSGYSAVTPTTPGHVFEVTYDPVAGTATWANLDGGTGPMGDLPVTDLVRDDKTGDLYAATDFGVMRLPFASSAWEVAGSGLPMVEVPGLTINADARVLYAATHGRSAWALNLP
jgi:Arc-like DNA binding domain